MPREKRIITAADILTLDQFEAVRAEKRAEHITRKKLRSFSVGPNARIYFESWDSMWIQIQEMLRIEKGGDEQLADEMAAYNPMIPNGEELTATLMFEEGDPVRRAKFLAKLGGVDQHIFLSIGDEQIAAMPEQDTDRTTASGKASAVQFLHFPMTKSQIALWKSGDSQAMVQIMHPNYGHAAIINAESRAELARDF